MILYACCLYLQYPFSQRSSPLRERSSALQRDPESQSASYRWDGLWVGMDASMNRQRDDGDLRVSPEDLQRIKQKLDRQERWAETLGATSPFEEPPGRGGTKSPSRRSPSQPTTSPPDMHLPTVSPLLSPRLEEDPSFENIRRKLNRQVDAYPDSRKMQRNISGERELGYLSLPFP